MKRRLRAVVFWILSACVLVPLSTRPMQAQRPAPEVRYPAFTQPIKLDTLVLAWERVNASRAETFAAVRAVFDSLKIETDYVDSVGGAIGALRARAPKRIGGERLSSFFNCGRSMTGENADTRRVTMTVVTFMRAVELKVTEVGTGLVGQAQDLSGSSNALQPCASLGVLEGRLAKVVQGKFTAPATP
jgi:hypothetical protein